MKRRTQPRRRPMRDRCHHTPGKFYLFSFPADGDNLYPRRKMLVYDNGALSGDAGLVTAAEECAAALRADMSEPLTALSLLLALYLPGVEIGGDVPVPAP